MKPSIVMALYADDNGRAVVEGPTTRAVPATAIEIAVSEIIAAGAPGVIVCVPTINPELGS